jgi:monoamine oxidase
MNEHWDDRVFFASAENAKNLEPTSRSTHWNVLHDENTPKYTKDALLLADPPPPYRTNYSDVRQSLGYLDGALVSGRNVASEIAVSLGVAVDPSAGRPTLSAPSPHCPPVNATPSGRAARPSAADALGVFESIRNDVDAVSEDDMRAWAQHPSGPSGYASWVHRSLVKALGEGGEGTDPVQRLRMVRDFAAAVAPHLGDDAAPDAVGPASEEEMPIFEKIRVLVADADAVVRKKLGL